MENTVTSLQQQTNINSFTPRQLVRRHIEHPEEPITEEDIINLDLTVNFSKRLVAGISETTNAYKKSKTGRSRRGILS